MLQGASAGSEAAAANTVVPPEMAAQGQSAGTTATAFSPVWNVDDDTEHILAVDGGDVSQPAFHDELLQDAHEFALSYARYFQALHQFWVEVKLPNLP